MQTMEVRLKETTDRLPRSDEQSHILWHHYIDLRRVPQEWKSYRYLSCCVNVQCCVTCTFVCI